MSALSSFRINSGEHGLIILIGQGKEGRREEGLTQYSWLWSSGDLQPQELQHGEGQDNLLHSWIVGTSFLSRLHHQAQNVLRLPWRSSG